MRAVSALSPLAQAAEERTRSPPADVGTMTLAAIAEAVDHRGSQKGQIPLPWKQ